MALQASLHHFLGQLRIRAPLLVDELDTDHAAEASDFRNTRQLLQRTKPLQDLEANSSRSVNQVLVFKDVQSGQGRRACDGIASVRGAVAARGKLVVQFPGRNERAERQTRTERLAEDKNVGYHAAVLKGEHLAGAAET